MKEIQAPDKYPTDTKDVLLFLAGSIEMGKAERWQDKIVEELAHIENVVILNPRRDDWDSSWVQSIDSPKFREQVEWELRALEDADVIVFYFDKDTKSPITLLELGLYANQLDKTILVCCPEGYWRKGNVDIVCHRYGVENVSDFSDFMKAVKTYVRLIEIQKDIEMPKPVRTKERQ